MHLTLIVHCFWFSYIFYVRCYCFAARPWEILRVAEIVPFVPFYLSTPALNLFCRDVYSL